MRWSVVGSVVLAAGFSSAALADGMPGRPAAYEAPFSWSGVYIGLNGGYSWGGADTGDVNSSQRTRVFRAFGLPAQTLISDVTVVGPGLGGSADVDGWIGGGQVGFNMQARGMVFGIEADLQWSGERGSSNFCSTVACGVGSAFLTTRHDQEWFGTLRARAGVLLDPRFLLYATGGVAYSHFSNDYTAGVVGLPVIAFSDDKKKGGWVVGGGAEWAIHRNLSLKAEYLYIDYGTVGGGTTGNTATVTTPDVPAVGFTTVVDTTANVALRTHLTDQVFRVGLNYRFHQREELPLK